MWIYLIDVQPDYKDVRAVLAESKKEAYDMVLEMHKDYAAKPSMRIYAAYRLLSPQHLPHVICQPRDK